MWPKVRFIAALVLPVLAHYSRMLTHLPMQEDGSETETLRIVLVSAMLKKVASLELENEQLRTARLERAGGGEGDDGMSSAQGVEKVKRDCVVSSSKSTARTARAAPTASRMRDGSCTSLRGGHFKSVSQQHTKWGDLTSARARNDDEDLAYAELQPITGDLEDKFRLAYAKEVEKQEFDRHAVEAEAAAKAAESRLAETIVKALERMQDWVTTGLGLSLFFNQRVIEAIYTGMLLCFHVASAGAMLSEVGKSFPTASPTSLT